MGQGRSLLLAIVALGLIGLSAFAVYWGEKALEQDVPETSGPAVPDGDPDSMFPDREETIVEEVAEEVVVPLPQELEIVGFVFVGDKQRAGGTVVLGEQEFPIEEPGVFRLPATERPRFSEVTFKLPGGRTLTFPWTLTDAAEEGDEAPPPFDPVSSRREHDLVSQAAEMPQRLRWTLSIQDAPGDRSDDFWIAPAVCLTEDWGLGGRVRVRGQSNLPEGASVHATFNFDGNRTASSYHGGSIADGSWEDLVPWDGNRHLFAGTYQLSSSFNLRLENSAIVDTWPVEVFERLRDLDELVSERFVTIGEPAEARAEDLAEQSYYCPLITDIDAAYDALKTRLTEVRRYSIGWNPSFLAASREAHRAWFYRPLIGEDGELDEQVWRQFLDDEFRPTIVERLDLHRTRVAKYVEAQQRIDGSLDSLHKLSYLYSLTRVYPAFGMRPHPNDEYDSGSAALGEVTILETRLEDNIDQLQRFCRLVERKRRPRF